MFSLPGTLISSWDFCDKLPIARCPLPLAHFGTFCAILPCRSLNLPISYEDHGANRKKSIWKGNHLEVFGIPLQQRLAIKRVEDFQPSRHTCFQSFPKVEGFKPCSTLVSGWDFCLKSPVARCLFDCGFLAKPGCKWSNCGSNGNKGQIFLVFYAPSLKAFRFPLRVMAHCQMQSFAMRTPLTKFGAPL